MEVKMFIAQESPYEAEQQINDWLRENNDVDVKHVNQSILGGSGGFQTVISVWFVRK